jgi:phenylpropionate dioxygenase-like ring-hydroxylating dioxygenase large terminal subunit
MLLKNFWYVLAEGEAVKVAPVKVRALGQDFVLFRRSSDGKVAALSDVCVHRMASLSGGKVDGDCVRCPYHGWAYGEDGACAHIPANPPGAPIPRRARVDSYPVEERYGWIWVFLGDLPAEERPPIPPFPELGQPGWRAVRGDFTWKAGYTRVVENAVDVAHTPFLHRSSFGNADNPVMPPYEVRSGPYSVEATVVLDSPKPRGLSRLMMGGASTNTVFLSVHLPNLTCLDSTFANGWRLRLLLSNLPVDEETTLTRFIQLRNFLPTSIADGFARRLSLQILREDQLAVESQRPRVVPADPGADLSTKSDALSIAYRKLLRRYADMGWRMDPREARRAYAEDERVLLIPSPRRRLPDLEGAWVLGEVPGVKIGSPGH